MAFAKVFLAKEINGTIVTKEAPVGFSWTIFIFSFLVPIFRRDWKWFGIMFGIWATGMVVAGASQDIALLIFLSMWVFPFQYNKFYLKDLLADGYKAYAADLGTVDQIAAKIQMPIPTE